MRRPALSKSTFAHFFHPKTHPHRPLHSSPRRSNASTDQPPPSDHIKSLRPIERIRQRKLDDLSDALRQPVASHVWAYYVDLLNFLGYEKLPVEIHQEVLRKCTPSTAAVRVAAGKRIEEGQMPRNPHVYEGRFQTIIQNIRSLGQTPTLDDYHFILEQFAAVGHHTGAIQVYKELIHLAIEPRAKTFGLCLQAIAHRLSLPCLEVSRPRLLRQVQKMTAELLADMQRFKLPLVSVNLDLAIRVLSESLDEKGLEALLKLAYGLDLKNLDRAPILDDSFKTAAVGTGIFAISAPQPFSTAALNTTIDMLGRLGNVSKMVQAFEVLTQPLPPQASRYFSSTFDDDDDFGISQEPPPTPMFTFPHAEPNTTTYNILLRHASRCGHSVFARHYLLQAMRLDRDTNTRLRHELSPNPKYGPGKPIEEVLAPHFSINRDAVLSVFGESNRHKDMALMRWLFYKLPKILRRKKNDILFYTKYRDALLEALQDVEASDDDETPSSARPSPILSERPSPTAQKPPPIENALDVDFDAPPVIKPSPVKYFDINLHIRLLERDHKQITMFSGRVRDVLGRSTQRIKERLGRRIWKGKDIYLATNKNGQRTKVSREKWKEIVNYRPRHVGLSTAHPWVKDFAQYTPPGSEYSLRQVAPHIQPGWLASHRGWQTATNTSDVASSSADSADTSSQNIPVANPGEPPSQDIGSRP